MNTKYSTHRVDRLIKAGKLDAAEKVCRAAVRSGLRDPSVYVNLAHIACQKRSFGEAIRLLESALAIDAGNVSALHNLGVIHDQAGDLAAAEQYYRRAMPLASENSITRRNLASLLLDKGDLAESRQLYEAEIAARPLDVDAHFAYSRMTRYTESDPTLSALQALTAHGKTMPVAAQVKIAFTVGKANQDMGRFDDAFAAFQTGNRLHFKHHPYSETQNYAMLEDVRECIDANLLTRGPESGSCDPMPIFVLGMPRSGSTLVEQILASHSGVSSAGEVKYLKQAVQKHLIGDRETFSDSAGYWSDQSFARCANDYLSELRQHAAGSPRVIDKMPGNFAFAGLINRLLPAAKIVHTTRAPMATIWSNYSTHFKDSLHYSYDLDVLCRYFAQYQASMRHWHSLLSENTLFELKYEELIRRPEQTVRDLLEFLNLPWEPDCLNYHRNRRPVRTASVAQVRQPLYTAAIDLWKNYRPQLGRWEAAVRENQKNLSSVMP